MKKAFLTACMAACFLALLSPVSQASSPKTNRNPGSKTIEAAHQDFPQAKQITWTQEGQKFIATFNMYGSKVTAIYGRKGELLSTLILISGKNLPFEIRTKVAQKYPDYQVKCVKDYMDKEGESYFFILEKQEGGRIDWLSIKLNDQEGFTTLQNLIQPV